MAAVLRAERAIDIPPEVRGKVAENFAESKIIQEAVWIAQLNHRKPDTKEL